MLARVKGGIQITISKIISLTDELRPNRFPDELKSKWLSDLDGQLYDELLSRFEGAGDAPKPYEDLAQELLIPDPYGQDLYCFYLQSCMDRENGETGRYNQSAALYNAALSAYTGHCLRSLKPRGPGPFKLKGEIRCPGCPF